MSSNPRVTSSNARVTSSNSQARVKGSHPRAQKSLNNENKTQVHGLYTFTRN